MTYEEVETSRQRFHTLQVKFANREAFYHCEFREYQEAIVDGSCTLPQSEFDRIFVRNISCLMKAQKIVGNDVAQESNFVDHEDDGYKESFEADMAAGADRFFINRWMELTEESQT